MYQKLDFRESIYLSHTHQYPLILHHSLPVAGLNTLMLWKDVAAAGSARCPEMG